MRVGLLVLFVVVCYIHPKRLASDVTRCVSVGLGLVPRRSEAVPWKAQLIRATAERVEGIPGAPVLGKGHSLTVHTGRKGLAQTRSGESTGCEFTKAGTTQRCCPIWMSGLCSMCGKMATGQGLESFIFWSSLEDNCFMLFTEILAD